MKFLKSPCFGLILLFAAAWPARALTIVADTTSISNSQMVSTIQQAINTVNGLYTNPITIPVTFQYAPGSFLLSTNEFYQQVSYSSYVNLLQSDSTAHPTNTVLATALANLGSGNNANGQHGMVVAVNLYDMLSGSNTGGGLAVVTISSTYYASDGSSQFDLIGGLEHELNEVLGGGGAGSALGCFTGQCGSFFTGRYGPLDLYRYSAAGVASFTTSSSATSYFSIDGGTTNIVRFNQNAPGDFGDFGPASGTAACGGKQCIQNAFNGPGLYELYTGQSPEFKMMESIGWNGTIAAVPEPETYATLLAGLGLLGFVARRRRPLDS